MFAKIFTLGRGLVAGAAENVADRNAITILEQELRDSKTALGAAQAQLAGLAGRRKLATNKYSELESQYLRYQASGQQAATSGNTELAQRVAERMQSLDEEGKSLRAEIDQSEATENKLKTAVQTTRDRIKTVEREIGAVKATEAVQKAQLSITRGALGANGHVSSAMDSLNRIKERQAEQSARLEAADELDLAMSGADLDKELANAGFLEGTSSSKAILESFSSGTPLIGSTSGFGRSSSGAGGGFGSAAPAGTQKAIAAPEEGQAS